ncbi:tRNA:m(4)X modification enzyme TRM13 [Chytridiales sp. JEL 0842]|nr:tRNA:m(4)X modification enzyme TRM13 [Chytridiales sp. JEL 0842]
MGGADREDHKQQLLHHHHAEDQQQQLHHHAVDQAATAANDHATTLSEQPSLTSNPQLKRPDEEQQQQQQRDQPVYEKATKRASKKPKQEPKPRPPPPPPPNCQFWLVKKSRYCPLTYRKEPQPTAGEEVIPYCHEHRVKLNIGGRRIPCPYDNRHGVFPEDLERHKHTCNQRPKSDDELYFVVPNINATNTPPSSSKNSASETRVPSVKIGTDKTYRDILQTISKEDFLNLAARIKAFWEVVKPETPFPTIPKTHPLLEERLSACKKGKHAYQVASLLGHLESSGLLSQSNLYMEFGCGKAEFSGYIHKAAGDPSRFLLIDRNPSRLKVQRHNPNTPLNTFTKVKVDIKDLDLGVLMEGRVGKDMLDGAPHVDGIVAVSKHLPECGLTKDDFGMMAVLSTWAVCGQNPINEDKEESQDETEKMDGDPSPSPVVDNHFSGLTFTQREELGLICKSIFDIGRARYLESKGLKVELVRYVGKEVSLENLALIAWRP